MKPVKIQIQFNSVRVGNVISSKCMPMPHTHEIISIYYAGIKIQT